MNHKTIRLTVLVLVLLTAVAGQAFRDGAVKRFLVCFEYSVVSSKPEVQSPQQWTETSPGPDAFAVLCRHEGHSLMVDVADAKEGPSRAVLRCQSCGPVMFANGPGISRATSKDKGGPA